MDISYRTIYVSNINQFKKSSFIINQGSLSKVHIETKNNRPKSTRIKYTNIQFIKATFHHVILYGLIWNEVQTVIHIFSLKVDKCDFEQVEIKCTQSCQRNDIDIYLSRYH